MKVKRSRKSASALLCFALLGSTAAASLSQMMPEAIFAAQSDTTSITLAPGSTGTLAGRSFEFYRVFDAQFSPDTGSVNYTVNPACRTALRNVIGKALNVSPSSLSDQQLLDYVEGLRTQNEGVREPDQSRMRTFVEALRPQLITSASPVVRASVQEKDLDSGGSYVLTGLAPGWYFVNEGSAADGNDYHAASLVVTDTVRGSTLLVLKNDLPSMTKKIFEDDNSTGWNDIGDYEAGQTIPYALETKVPAIGAYSTYFMSFHDVMDPGLIFQPGSVHCYLISSKKRYELSADDFELITGQNGDTFEVRVGNIKSLVDQNFASINPMEQEYGQTFRVEFSARIGDQAFTAGQGAVPLENRSRLEFSNDPRFDMDGSHGFTPWDPVVAYTYLLDAQKTDEHAHPLAGATFRLYEDQNCTKEILVRKALDGYLVLHADVLNADPSLRSQAVPVVSGEQGEMRIYGLDQGTYYLKEIEAPQGYRPLAAPVTLTLEPTFTDERNSYVQGQKDQSGKILRQLKATASITSHYLGVDQTVQSSLETKVNPPKASLRITNQTGMRLPLTGSGTALLCAGGGTLLVIAGLGSGKLRRKNGSKKKSVDDQSGS